MRFCLRVTKKKFFSKSALYSSFRVFAYFSLAPKLDVGKQREEARKHRTKKYNKDGEFRRNSTLLSFKYEEINIGGTE
jgi:hypothetical protein